MLLPVITVRGIRDLPGEKYYKIIHLMENFPLDLSLALEEGERKNKFSNVNHSPLYLAYSFLDPPTLEVGPID